MKYAILRFFGLMYHHRGMMQISVTDHKTNAMASMRYRAISKAYEIANTLFFLNTAPYR